MKYYGLTDRGKLRKTNQDNYVIATNENGDVFAIVCDGIGGGRGGDIASHLAVSYFSVAFASNKGFSSGMEVRSWIAKHVEEANRQIYQMGMENSELKGMGTTFCAVMITSVGNYIANIGDSRVYSYKRTNIFKPITTDHTLVNDMIRHGELTPKEAAVYPQKNVLTNALGVWLNVKCDIEAYSEKVDGFLVCSDGLYGYVSEKVLKKIVFDSDNHPVLRVKQLIKAAMNAGGFDNITAILIDLEGAGTHE